MVFQHLQVFLNGIKLRLKNLLLHLRRLRYLSELVVRHYHAVIIIVPDVIKESHTVLRLETLFIGEEYAGIWICGLIGHGNLGNIGFESDNHRFVC